MEGTELTAQSIYGGVKASQEADNILILQNNQGKSGLLQGKKYIQVVKNRFDGELGIVPLNFDKESQSYAKEKSSKSGISGATLAKLSAKPLPAPATVIRPPTSNVPVISVDAIAAARDGDADDDSVDANLADRRIIKQ